MFIFREDESSEHPMVQPEQTGDTKDQVAEEPSVTPETPEDLEPEPAGARKPEPLEDQKTDTSGLEGKKSDSGLSMLDKTAVSFKKEEDEPPKIEIPEPEELAAPGKGLLIIQCIKDSVWLNITRRGKPDEHRYMLKGDLWKIGYKDTVKVHSGVKEGLKVLTNRGTHYPKERRFKFVWGRLVE
jgi:hypothetical protein